MKGRFSTLGDAAQFINGFAFGPEHWETTGLPIIRIQNLTGAGKPFIRTTASVPDRYVVKPGELLVSWSATLGVFEWDRQECGLVNQHIFRVVPDKSVAFKSYLKYAIAKALAGMERFSHGSTMRHINREEFLATRIWLPALEEQKRIATILDLADTIRQKRQGLLEQEQELIGALFFDHFGDAHNAKGWELKRLEDLCTRITDGVHARPAYTDHGVPFISVKDITTGRLSFADCKFISPDDHETFSKRCRPEPRDILYTKVGATYGRPAIVDTDKPFSLYVSVALLKPRPDRVNPHFLREILDTPLVKRQADRSVKGAGVPDLHLVEIKNFTIPTPPLKIQNAFVDLLARVHRNFDDQRRSFDQARELCAAVEVTFLAPPAAYVR